MSDKKYQLYHIMSLQELCPYCGSKYADRVFENYRRREHVDKIHHEKYVELLNKKFGDNAWPICLHCYYEVVELCHDCGMILMDSPIYWSSSASKYRIDHKCIDCVGKK
jgi:hypothetical protein